MRSLIFVQKQKVCSVMYIDDKVGFVLKTFRLSLKNGISIIQGFMSRGHVPSKFFTQKLCMPLLHIIGALTFFYWYARAYLPFHINILAICM